MGRMPPLAGLIWKIHYAVSFPRLGSWEKTDNPSHSERSEESVVVCFQEDKCRCFAKFTLSEQTADPSLRVTAKGSA
jgi:hypothetical protein